MPSNNSKPGVPLSVVLAEISKWFILAGVLELRVWSVNTDSDNSLSCSGSVGENKYVYKLHNEAVRWGNTRSQNTTEGFLNPMLWSEKANCQSDAFFSFFPPKLILKAWAAVTLVRWLEWVSQAYRGKSVDTRKEPTASQVHSKGNASLWASSPLLFLLSHQLIPSPSCSKGAIASSCPHCPLISLFSSGSPEKGTEQWQAALVYTWRLGSLISKERSKRISMELRLGRAVGESRTVGLPEIWARDVPKDCWCWQNHGHRNANGCFLLLKIKQIPLLT